MLRSLLALAFLLGLPSAAFAQDQPSTDSPAPPEALAEAARRVVALSMGTQITEGDLQLDERLIQLNQTSLDDEAFADWYRRARVERLTELVFVPLLGEYAKSNGLEATQAEVDDFIARSDRAREEAEAQFTAQKEALEAELARGAISPSERAHMESQLETLTTILGSRAEMEQRARERFGEDYETRMRKIDEDLARQTIVAWKINKSLFDKYRGRVVYRQDGPEPLDAYAAFLADRKKEGAFGIYDTDLEAAFWDALQNENLHDFYSTEESHNIMKTPWWEREAPASTN